MSKSIKFCSLLKVNLACVSGSVVSDSATPWSVACQATLSNSPGKNTDVDCYSVLQGIFPTQGSNSGLYIKEGFVRFWKGDRVVDYISVSNFCGGAKCDPTSHLVFME